MKWLRQIQEAAEREFKEQELKYFKYGISLNMPLQEVDWHSEKGTISRKVESEGCEVMRLEDAIKDEKYAEILRKHLMQRAFYPRENKATAFHAANIRDCTFIHVPQGNQAKVRLKTEASGAAASHVFLWAEKNSKVEVAEELTGEGLVTTAVEAFLAEGVTASYETLQDLDDGWHFGVNRAVIGKEAEMNWFTAITGGKISRYEISSDMAGEGARTKNLGVFIGTDEQKFDIYNTSIHTKPNTYSDMDNKGIVLDNSKSIFRGLINIKENARNSNGYQKQDTLMLSENAEADAVPNLEIFNNDVMCSHGATIGQVDDDKIFYLMSRGLSRKEAEREIVAGFLGSMIDRATDEEIRKRIKSKVEERWVQ